MRFFPRFLLTVLLVATVLLAAPSARAQVGVSINVGRPAWGPPVPYGVQYYYIPEIDGYYDLQSQQYIVFQDGYWVPLPELYGYDPYQFHPVVIDYRGREPWQQLDYCHSRYAYRPYRSYGREGYYLGGYGRPRYARHDDDRRYGNRGYGNRDYDNRGYGRYPGGDRGRFNGSYQNGAQNIPDRGGYNRNNPSQRSQPSQGQQGSPDGGNQGHGHPRD